MAKSKKATWIILLAMLGYGCLLLGAATSVRAAECKKTSDADDIKNVKGTGKACTEKEAMQAAFDNLGDEQCTGKSDPKCPPEGSCAKGTCGKTATEHAHYKHSCANVRMENCENNSGKECTVSGDFHCGCRCK